MLAGYELNSGKDPVVNNPSPERVFVAVMMYVWGVVLMLGTDAQKYFVLRERKGLITHGFNTYCRNMNYFGEILLYASFNVVA